MPAAPLPPNEIARLQALINLDILDTPPEEEFDILVQTAALVCNVPISLISLVDETRQWFKANIGLEGATETPRSMAFCAHAILDNTLLEVPDATLDPRFQDNPLVTGNPDIRFYAGAPLRLSDGQQIGTLCVIDQKPNSLNATQREILRNLAAAASKALEGRRALLAEHRITQEIVKASSALLSSEARFRALTESSPLGVFSTNPQGSCTYTNKRWQEIYGLSFNDSLGDGWSKALHPDDREFVFTEWNRRAPIELDFDMEFRVIRGDGEIRYVHARARPILSTENTLTGFIGTVEDITERVLTDQSLHEERVHLASVIEGTDAGTWEWNIQTGQTHFNDRWAAILGYQLAEMEPISISTWAQFTHADDLAIAQVRLNQHFDGLTPNYECELRMRHKRGHWVWVLSRGRVLSRTHDGKPEWMFGTHLDITLLVEQRQKLETANQRIALATESGGIGIWDYDLATQELRWDAWMYQLYGLPVEQGTDTYELWSRSVHPDDIARAEHALQEAISGQSVFNTSFRVVWPDNSIHHLRATAQITRDNLGNPLRMVGVNWDVTQVHELTNALSEQYQLLHVTLQSIGDAVITTDPQGITTWLNPVAERMTGWSTNEAKGRPLTQIFNIVNEETRRPTENPVYTCLEQGKIVGLANHTLLISRDGDEYGIEDSAAPIRNTHGEVLGVVLVFHDVTEQRRLSGEMSYRASHDVLTGLINRGEFETRLRRLLKTTYTDHSVHALMFIDLDQFKLVNDACGHSVGDELLQQVSKLFLDCVRSRDTLARLGGDEFAVLLEHCSTDQAQRVAQDICDRMNNFRFQHEDRRFRIGTSIGLVVVDKRWSTPEAVLQAADTSCYAAKEAGRNRVHVWFDSDQAMRARHNEMQWATRIEQALDDDGFVLYAQRIESLTQNPNALHAEVLLRMIDADGKIIAPGAFLPAVERFHLSARVDRWVLRHAITWLESLSNLSAIETLCINLSGQSIGDRSFHKQALEMLRATKADVCKKICLEITETAAVTNMADASVFIDQVRGLGVLIALDDFGAGASSFGYLKTLTVDILKIDGQFITDLIDDPLDDAAVRCFVDVARVVGVKTVAEFVDRPEILARVRSIGIDYAQGFLLHKPEPIEGIIDANKKRKIAV